MFDNKPGQEGQVVNRRYCRLVRIQGGRAKPRLHDKKYENSEIKGFFSRSGKFEQQ